MNWHRLRLIVRTALASAKMGMLTVMTMALLVTAGLWLTDSLAELDLGRALWQTLFAVLFAGGVGLLFGGMYGAGLPISEKPKRKRKNDERATQRLIEEPETEPLTEPAQAKKMTTHE